MWYAVSVTSRYEIETAKRINNSGHPAYCPTYQIKLRYSAKHPNIFEPKTKPLFGGYIFADANAPFHKDKYETDKVRLIVWRNLMVSEAQMAIVRETESELAAAALRAPGSFRVSVGDVVALRNALFANESLKVLESRKAKLLVQSERMVRPVWVSTDQVERIA